MSTPKRSLDDHSPRSNTSQSANKPDEGAKKRAKDWRDAFLDDAPPSRYRERSRDRDRSRDPRRDDRGRGDRERDRNYDRSYRHSDGLDYDADRKTDRRDRDGPSDRHRDRDDRYHSSRSDRERPDRERETDRYGAKGHSTSTSSGSAYREHARRGEGATGPGGPAGSGGAGPYNRSGRQYGDTFSYADPSRTRPATSTSPSHPHAPATSSGNRAVGRGMSIAGRSRAPIGQNDDREEGEIDSPPKQAAALPTLSENTAHQGNQGSQPPQPNRIAAGGFRSINIPSQPRAARLGGMNGTGNVLEGGNDERAAKRARVEDESASGAKGKDKEEEQSNEPVIVIEEELDPEKVLEERRRKREEIMARYKANKAAEGGQPQAGGVVGDIAKAQLLGTGADSVTSAGTRTGLTTGATPALRALGTRSTSVMAGNASTSTPSGLAEPSLASTPLGKDFDLTKSDASPSKATVKLNAEKSGGDDTSAADYDPSAAALEDQAKREHDRALVNPSTDVGVKAVADGVGEPARADAVAATPKATVDPAQDKTAADDDWEEVEMEVDDDDEEVDMFAAFGEDEDQPKKKKLIKVRRRKAGAAGAGGGAGDVGADTLELVQPKSAKKAATAVDNVDDMDGYYRITPGEILDDGRYQVTINLGKGMFSAVVKAKVLKAVDQERRQDVVGKEVAIKVIRSQESMYVAGRKEAQILKKLNEADPEDKKHIVRMERTFQHHGHLCIVTESLSMNLRDVIKRFGKDVGLNMRAVRAYAHQLFLALSLMRKCGYVHADIKPDNVLVSENKATLKVCDLGSAAEVSEGEITPYLVSRFYRAPEIILGLPYDTSIDIWSIGCTLYELYTGKILFPGRSNNHMLRLMMEVKGKINHRLIKKATFGEMYFDENINFLSVEKDKITGADVLKTLVITSASRDLRSRLLPPSSVQMKMKDDEIKLLLSFVDLLEKCLHLDPAKRITPRDALLHPFLSG